MDIEAHISNLATCALVAVSLIGVLGLFGGGFLLAITLSPEYQRRRRRFY